MFRRREWKRKRYAENPEYRRKELEYSRAYYAAYKAEINANRRRRWASDPEYRERALARNGGNYRRRHHLKLQYGMSLEEYDALLARQGGACAICKRKFDKTLCVDHCHTTGGVRGLLCRKCNAGLGCYDDEPSLMLAAAAYLKAFRGDR